MFVHIFFFFTDKYWPKNCRYAFTTNEYSVRRWDGRFELKIGSYNPNCPELAASSVVHDAVNFDYIRAVSRRYASTVGVSLASSFNWSSEKGMFPSCWRLSHMFPVHKSGDRRDVKKLSGNNQFNHCSQTIRNYYLLWPTWINSWEICYSEPLGFYNNLLDSYGR